MLMVLRLVGKRSSLKRGSGLILIFFLTKINNFIYIWIALIVLSLILKSVAYYM